MTSESNSLERALTHARNGQPETTNQLATALYQELRALAGSFFKAENDGHTLQPTALVHEAWMRLCDRSATDWNDRKHFIQAAAQAMRLLLTDHARRRKAQKRGGNRGRVSLRTDLAADNMSEVDLVTLHDSLNSLRALHERQALIVEMRFLMGFSVEESAKVLGLSDRTIELDSRMALAWLRRDYQLTGSTDE